MLAMFERKLMVIVPRFETMLSHADVNLRFARCCSDSGFVDDIVDKASTIKRAKVFISAVAWPIGLDVIAVLSENLWVVALDDACYVASAALADLHITPIKYLVQYVWRREMFIKVEERSRNFRLDIFTVRRVEPNDVSWSVPASFKLSAER